MEGKGKSCFAFLELHGDNFFLRTEKLELIFKPDKLLAVHWPCELTLERSLERGNIFLAKPYYLVKKMQIWGLLCTLQIHANFTKLFW